MKWILLLGWESVWAIQDFRNYRISRLFLYGAVLTGAAAQVQRILVKTDTVRAIPAAVLPGILMLALGFLTEGKLGKADGYMVLAIGLFLGWELCTAVLAAACLLAALYAGCGIALGKLNRKSRICFAPFLLTATLLVWGIS
ncbi:MAG: prepilin peptidase [Lachnospiraceae bacterium]|nr:prepilin peptidase [Lachnospiraceae bacterium]